MVASAKLLPIAVRGNKGGHEEKGHMHNWTVSTPVGAEGGGVLLWAYHDIFYR
jgi:hypothetical protein